MQGVVTDAGTHKPLWPTTIVNLSTQQSASTNEFGLYTIAANPGDVIAFSYIGYKSVEKVKSATELVSGVDVAMVRTGYLLREFSVRPGHLTQYQIDSSERRSTYKVVLRQTHANPFMSPFSAIAEKFSKKSKRTFRFQKDFYSLETMRFIDTRYTPELVKELTGATGDSIGHFMYDYPMPYDYARVATDLELKMWIRNSYREWARKDSIAIATAGKQETSH